MITFSIVFIHGLRGHPRNTWQYVPKAQIKPWHESRKRKFFDRATKSLRRQKESSQNTEAVLPAQAIHWPAQILPQEIPQARIWTYGYNADVIAGFFRQNNKNSILQHANDLMVKLERTFDDEVSWNLSQAACIDANLLKRPIVFVAHSLGGIILKRVRVLHLFLSPN
jgi:hypothetical protein